MEVTGTRHQEIEMTKEMQIMTDAESLTEGIGVEEILIEIEEESGIATVEGMVDLIEGIEISGLCCTICVL